MNDRKLLELAAKAAGAKHVGPGRCCGIEGKHRKVGLLCDNDLYWNPLVDDGDALRLVVYLSLTVRYGRDYATVYAGSAMFSERFRPDAAAATRHAIVRAAAEIGRNMQEAS